MRPLLLAACALAFPGVALAGSWAGTWANDGVGTNGAARLSVGRETTLRLGGAAFGCAQPVVLHVRYGSGRISGSGGSLPCNHGVRWMVSGPAGAAAIHVRLPDGSRAELRLALRERRQ
jgi:hypothetical protein